MNKFGGAGGVLIEHFYHLKINISAFERLNVCEAGRNINSIRRYKMKLISHIVDSFFIHSAFIHLPFFSIVIYLYLSMSFTDGFGFQI